MPLQSSSWQLQTSTEPGWLSALVSSQSVPSTTQPGLGQPNNACRGSPKPSRSRSGRSVPGTQGPPSIAPSIRASMAASGGENASSGGASRPASGSAKTSRSAASGASTSSEGAASTPESSGGASIPESSGLKLNRPQALSASSRTSETRIDRRTERAYQLGDRHRLLSALSGPWSVGDSPLLRGGWGPQPAALRPRTPRSWRWR